MYGTSKPISLIKILIISVTVLASVNQISFARNYFPDDKGTLRGLVVDSTSGEVLAYCNVVIEELKTGASTDIRGYFRIPSIPSGKTYTLLASYVGYRSKEVKFSVQPNIVSDIKIELSPVAVELNQVEKVGYRTIEKNATDASLQRISIKDIENIPQGVETDIFRSLQFIPGVQSTGDVSARYYVRGSPTNENLVLLNGVTIYDPFHAFGLFSVIDPDIINDVEFYKGGYPAEYGERLSSVLNIVTKDGNKNRVAGTASASFLTGKAELEGPIYGGSFILSGRTSLNSNILKKFLNNENAPIDFYDLYGKINLSDPHLIKGSKLTLQGFKSHDALNYNNPDLESLNWSNEIYSLRWFQIVSSPAYYDMTLSYSDFNGNVNPNNTSTRPKNNDVQDYSFGMYLNYMFDSKDEMDFGFQIKSVNATLGLENLQGVWSYIASNGANFTLFSSYRLLRYSNFGLDIGTRFNLISLSDSHESISPFEPRVSLTYVLSHSISLKGAWGIYRQEMTTLTDDNEIISMFEPWIIVPDYLKIPTAIHYSLEMKDEVSDNLSVDLQGYYRVLHDIPTVNDAKIVPGQPDLISSSGRSYGLETLFKYDLGRIGLTISYSLEWAFKTVDTLTYRPRYDSRNNLNILGNLNIGDGWQFSVMWIYNSGHPFTQTLGFYEKLYFDNLYNKDKYYGNYMPFVILASKNLGTLPQYHRLDVSLSKKFNISFLKISLSASIINVYNRKNIFYFQRDTGKRVNMLPFLPTATIKVEL